MSMQEHVNSLKHKHAALEVAISEESKRPMPDEIVVHDLKRRKLKIKDEIQRLGS